MNPWTLALICVFELGMILVAVEVTRPVLRTRRGERFLPKFSTIPMVVLYLALAGMIAKAASDADWTTVALLVSVVVINRASGRSSRRHIEVTNASPDELRPIAAKVARTLGVEPERIHVHDHGQPNRTVVELRKSDVGLAPRVRELLFERLAKLAPGPAVEVTPLTWAPAVVFWSAVVLMPLAFYLIKTG
jgi:hypothetical protein